MLDVSEIVITGRVVSELGVGPAEAAPFIGLSAWN